MKIYLYFKNKKGFTLIELLVVVAIIGLLSSIVLASLNSARAKARDTKKKEDLHSIYIALNLFYDSTGHMPANNWCGYVCPGAGFWGACENAGYDMSMQELVDAKFLPAIPKSPGGGVYCYYNYGPNNAIGVITQTTLEAAPDTMTGIPPSCRPFTGIGPGANWCPYDVATKQYCMCNIY